MRPPHLQKYIAKRGYVLVVLMIYLSDKRSGLDAGNVNAIGTLVLDDGASLDGVTLGVELEGAGGQIDLDVGDGVTQSSTLDGTGILNGL